MGGVHRLSEAPPARQRILGAVADGLLALLGSVDAETVLHALGQLGDALSVQMVYVAEHHRVSGQGRSEVRVLHRWTAKDADATTPAEISFSRPDELEAGGVLCLHPQRTGPRDPIAALGVKTLVTVPIMIGSQCWGQLGLVDFEAEVTWSDDVNSAVSAVAAAFGATLERQRAFDSVRRHAGRMRSLHEVTSRLSRDLPSQVQRALALAATSLGHETGVVVRIEKATPRECEVLYAFSPTPDIAVGQRWPVGRDFFAEAAAGPMLWPDGDKTDDAARQAGICSYIALPLWVEGEPYGALTLASRHARTEAVTEADLEFLGLMGNWVEATLEQQLADARRASLERQVERAQRLHSLGVALGGIAHDFNNLLMVTATGLSLARDAMENGDTALVPHLLSNARRATDRATALAAQLLTFAGRPDLMFAPTDVGRLLEEHLPGLRRGLNSQVVLEIDDPEALRDVCVDKAAVLEVVSNLVLNASEADPGNVPIRVRASVAEFEVPPTAYFVAEGARAGRYACVEVEDAGRGMAEESLRRVFDPFFTTKFTGRGLGLSEAMGVVRAHRGAIDLDSAPGRGTRVRVLFPFDAPPPEDVPRPSSREPSGPRPQAHDDEYVLLVDDEDMLRETLVHALEQQGIKVDAASNGVEALELLRASPKRYSAMVLDVTMPVMDGKEALTAVRETHPHLPVVLVSGYTEENVGVTGSPDEPTGFLQKPFGTSSLLHSLRALRRRFGSQND